MGDLLNILMYSLGSIFSGILIAVGGVFLMFFTIHLWWRNSNFTPLSFLVAFILFFFLSYQAVLICGAITIKTYGDDVERTVNELMVQVPLNTQLSSNDTQVILDQVNSEFPIVGYYVNKVESCRGNTPSSIAKSLVDALHRYLNWFILRRIGWCLLFIICGAISVINTISKENRRGKSLRYYTSKHLNSRKCSRYRISKYRSK